MDPSTQLSLFNAWRHPAMGGMAGMDITQAAYRYNQNMMEYYTCKSKSNRFRPGSSVVFFFQTF